MHDPVCTGSFEGGVWAALQGPAFSCELRRSAWAASARILVSTTLALPHDPADDVRRGPMAPGQRVDAIEEPI